MKTLENMFPFLLFLIQNYGRANAQDADFTLELSTQARFNHKITTNCKSQFEFISKILVTLKMSKTA